MSKSDEHLQIKERIEAMVMVIHRRNGGDPQAFDWDTPFFSNGLTLDSLDFAEVVVRVEKEFGVKPFDVGRPPTTWTELLEVVCLNVSVKGDDC